MDEVSRGLDEMALGAPDNNNINPSNLVVSEGIGFEACGCAELVRNDSAGTLATPLHRCKGRHHLPIIGEEMQGDQPLPKPGEPDLEKSKTLVRDVAQDSTLTGSHEREQACPERQKSEQTTSMGHRIPTLSASDQPTTTTTTTTTTPQDAKCCEGAAAAVLPRAGLARIAAAGIEEVVCPGEKLEQTRQGEHAENPQELHEDLHEKEVSPEELHARNAGQPDEPSQSSEQ